LGCAQATPNTIAAEATCAATPDGRVVKGSRLSRDAVALRGLQVGLSV
jgi:hypothetical protein